MLAPHPALTQTSTCCREIVDDASLGGWIKESAVVVHVDRARRRRRDVAFGKVGADGTCTLRCWTSTCQQLESVGDVISPRAQCCAVDDPNQRLHRRTTHVHRVVVNRQCVSRLKQTKSRITRGRPRAERVCVDSRKARQKNVVMYRSAISD